MTVTASYNEDADFWGLPTLPANIGLTMVNANGYSGLITLTATTSTYDAGDYDVGGSRYWMGSLWLGGITAPSSTQNVEIKITTDNTDVGLFEYSPGAGSAANYILFQGNNDSISMSDAASGGETMDLSGTTFAQWNGSTWITSGVKVIIHGTGGNDTFTGSSQNNYLYEGAGNSVFNQSAGNDIISTQATNGGSNIYYAKDALADYEGGYVDSNGNSYMNDGDDWLLQDTANGKIIELTDVASVGIGGTTYSASVENPAQAWTTDDSTSSSASVEASSALASIASGAGLHASMLATSAVNALNVSASTSTTTASTIPSNDVSYSSSSLATLLGTHDNVASGVLTDDKSSPAVVAS